MKNFIIISFTIVALATVSTNADREISCNYYTWTDERGYFEYCATWDQPLTENFKHEVHKFSGSAEKQHSSAIKFIRAGRVDFIPEEIVTTFPKLDGFILEASDIPVLRNGLFTRRFSNMKFLEIYGNNLKEIEKDAFTNFPNLEWIRLSSNKIEIINVNIFENNKHLKYIDLRNNFIRSLTPNLFKGLNNLEQVLFEGSNICSQKNFKKSDNTLGRIDSDLKTCFDNSRISTFREIPCHYYTWNDERGYFEYCATWDQPLTGNFKNEVHKFSGSAEKQHSTAVKFIRAGKVDFIPEDMVSTFPKLDGFVLESSDIPVLKNGLFTKRFSNMKFLEIQHNNLKEVEEDAFMHLPNLEWIRLASNQIEMINVDIFKNHKNLKYIDLRNNIISSLTPSLFEGLNNLEQVLFAVRNLCSQKNFMKSDDTLKEMEKDLETCYDNCSSSKMCDSASISVDPDIDIRQQIFGQSLNRVSLINIGTEFTRGKWPWMAAFYFKDAYICAGSLISNKHILTAAHCVMDKGEHEPRLAKDSHFLLGKYDLSVTEEGQLKVNVARFVINSDWDNAQHTKYIGDIAIAHLAQPVIFTTYIKPIRLNPASNTIEDYISNGYKGTVTGWGTTEKYDGIAERAREVVIPLVKSLQCLSSDVTFFNIFSQNSSFCGGNRDGKGPCKGDSGGGVYVKRGNQWILVGITSASLFADHKCDFNNYVIFTDVGKHDRWILENIN